MAFDRAKSLSEFAWSRRVRDAFEHDNLRTVGDVIDRGAIALLRIPGFGHRSLDEVENTLGVDLTLSIERCMSMSIDTFAERYINPTIRKWRRRLLGV